MNITLVIHDIPRDIGVSISEWFKVISYLQTETPSFYIVIYHRSPVSQRRQVWSLVSRCLAEKPVKGTSTHADRITHSVHFPKREVCKTQGSALRNWRNSPGDSVWIHRGECGQESWKPDPPFPNFFLWPAQDMSGFFHSFLGDFRIHLSTLLTGFHMI